VYYGGMPKAKAKDPELSPEMLELYEHLKRVRASKTCSLKPCPIMREQIRGFSGQMEPLRLRYYQVQGIYHMLRLKRMILGDGTGLGKTCQAIGALAYLWSTPKEAGNKVIVLAPKSAVNQWAEEIKRFTVGVRPIVASAKANSKETSLEARTRAYEDWANAPAEEKVVLILNYSLLVRDWNEGGFQPTLPDGKPDPKAPVKPGLLDALTAKVGGKLVVIFDEVTAFKSKRTKTWEISYFLSVRAHRVYGLSATILKNRLFEGYCIFGVIRPGTFTTQSKFFDDFCFIELKKMGKARIPIVLGYKNLDKFKAVIDPFFLGRPKHVVSDELPTLTTREILCELGPAEELKYQEALSGVLELGDGEVKEYSDHKALVSLGYCQQVVNSLAMLGFNEGSGVGDDFIHDPKKFKVGALSGKEQGLLDLLTGELEDEKVIVYTRYASLVPRLQAILLKEGLKSTRITGKENGETRKVNQDAFQDFESGTNVIFITDAGSEAINLQAAAATIFFDAPWSWGNYIQILGRMIRIGSPHKGVLVYHLVATRPREDSKTIDHHVLALLRKKKGLIDKVLGEAAIGALTFETGTDLRDLMQMMRGKAA
jgi:SNF2 family DNA or RNA helicase